MSGAGWKFCKWRKGSGPKPRSGFQLALRPFLTTRAECLDLMTNEFHKPGQRTFDSTEPDSFIERLTCDQLHLLNVKMPKKRLTAFIIFGDGNIDYPMGADFCREEGNSVRPNASFALFFKERSRVELVFYTRFFTISYSHHSASKALCKTFAKDRIANRNVDSLRQRFFEAMKSLVTSGWPFRNQSPFVPLNSWKSPHRYELHIYNLAHPTIVGAHIPYIGLKDPSADYKTPPWFSAPGGKVNTIHGMLLTKGCWMLTRNFLWNWPDEWKVAEGVADCLVQRQTGTPDAGAEAFMKNALKSKPYSTVDPGML